MKKKKLAYQNRLTKTVICSKIDMKIKLTVVVSTYGICLGDSSMLCYEGEEAPLPSTRLLHAPLK